MSSASSSLIILLSKVHLTGSRICPKMKELNSKATNSNRNLFPMTALIGLVISGGLKIKKQK
jgi:hypothetical protein